MPFLYSNICWTWRGRYTILDRELEWRWLNIPSIIPFLRSVLRRPQLASHIRTIALDSSSLAIHHIPGAEYALPITLAGLKRPIELVREFSNSISFADLWEQELRSGTLDAFVAVLLTQTHNLTSLRLDYDFPKNTRITGMLLRSSLCDPKSSKGILPSFHRLSHVSISVEKIWSYSTEHKNGLDIAALFYLPAVQKISAVVDWPGHVEPYPIFAWPTEKAPNTSSLESLDLACVLEGCLGPILSATTKLEKLSWDWVYQDNYVDDDGVTVMDLGLMVESLSCVKQTLTDLTILAAPDLISSKPGEEDVTFKGSLKGLHNLEMLKTFKVPLPFVVGYTGNPMHSLQEIMPKNVEFLTLTDDLCMRDDDEFEDCIHFHALKQLLMDPLPSHIRSIHLLLKTTGIERSWTATTQHEIVQLCDNAGVHFEVTLLHKRINYYDI